jgi:hypothetical protein
MKSLLIVFIIGVCQISYAKIWHVGPSRTYTYCHQVASLVQNGDTVYIDFATYLNVPQVIWKSSNLLIKGINGRPRLQAGNTIANDAVNGKGIFVVTGANVKVENIEFANAAVKDMNGAGIRQEGINLWVYRCKFEGNEMGILQGGTIANCKTTVEYCEFLNGGSVANPGYQHNIYINHIDTFIFRYNFSYNAIAEGHELKSRANFNFIAYNTIANYESKDSRNIDIPNGGTSIIMGNIIEQGPNTSNSNMLAYGLEGLTNTAPHHLYIVNNTFVNKHVKGSFIHLAAGTNTLFLKNNILAGAKTGGLIVGNAMTLDSSNNIITDNLGHCGFVDINKYKYQLMKNSMAKDAGIAISTKVFGYHLKPSMTYKDTCHSENRVIQNTIDIGAYEFNDPLRISEAKISPNIVVYPNPASTHLFVDFTKINNSELVEIYNNKGVLVKKRDMGDQERMDISDLPTGLYFIQTMSQTFKFIKN